MRVIAAVLMLSCLACAQFYPQSNSLSVTGDADVKVVPDRVDLMTGVETRNPDLHTATMENDASVRRVIAMLRKMGIDGSDIQTDYIHVDLTYDSHNATSVAYYTATKAIQVVLKDVTKFEDLLQQVLGAGVNHIYCIEFSTSELRKYRDQARALAVKAAIEKANDLATSSGLMVVGKPTSLSTYSYGGGSSYRYCCSGMYMSSNMAQNVVQNAGGGGSSESSVALGKITVSASVTMNFQVQ
jgi:uncharacterized protein